MKTITVRRVFQPLPGARQVPVGGVLRQRGGRGGQGRGAPRGARLRALHGRRLQDDHHRRRVSLTLLTPLQLAPRPCQVPLGRLPAGGGRRGREDRAC